MNAVEGLNIGLAVMGVLVAFGAVHRMSAETECPIILAFVTVASGLGGQILGALAWQGVFDTLLFGGVTALMIGTRRQTVWISPDWMPRVSLAVSLLSWAAFLVGLES